MSALDLLLNTAVLGIKSEESEDRIRKRFDGDSIRCVQSAVDTQSHRPILGFQALAGHQRPSWLGWGHIHLLLENSDCFVMMLELSYLEILLLCSLEMG